MLSFFFLHFVFLVGETSLSIPKFPFSKVVFELDPETTVVATAGWVSPGFLVGSGVVVGPRVDGGNVYKIFGWLQVTLILASMGTRNSNIKLLLFML